MTAINYSSDKARAFFKYKAKRATNKLRSAHNKAKADAAYILSPKYREDIEHANYVESIRKDHGCLCYCGACMGG